MRRILFTSLVLGLLLMMVAPAAFAGDDGPVSGGGTGQVAQPPEAPRSATPRDGTARYPGVSVAGVGSSDVGGSWTIWWWTAVQRYIGNRAFVCTEGYTSADKLIYWAQTSNYLCKWIGSWSCTAWSTGSAYNVRYITRFWCMNDALWRYFYTKSQHRFMAYSTSSLLTRYSWGNWIAF